MLETLKFGKGNWANKTDSTLAYSDQYGNFQAIPFDFTRATTATRVNKQGLIKSVNEGIARIDYSDSTQGALLLEPQRTNLVIISESLDTYLSSKSASAVITDNYGIAPNGLQSSSRIQLPSNDYCSRGITLSTNNTSSVYVKGIVGETIGFGVGANVGQGGLFTFNGSWQRIEYVDTNGGSAIFFSSLQASATATDFEAFGLQIEDNVTYATSYIPTSGTTVTRNQERCVDATPEINSEEGVLYAEIAALSNDATNRYLTLTNGTSNERVALLFSANTNELRAIIFSSTQSINISFTTSSVDILDYNKIAIRYKSGGYAFYVNGNLIGTNASIGTFTANTLNELSFDVGSGSLPFFGNTKGLKVYPKALSDVELETLTSWSSFREMAEAQSYIVE